MLTGSPHDVRGGIAVESPLAWLLHPLPVPTFLDQVFRVRHHHIARGRPDYFDGLLGAGSAADELLRCLQPEPAAVHAVRGAAYRDAAAYRLDDGTLDIAAVHRDLADGYTVILDNLERYLRTLGELTHAIEVDLDYATQVNAYLTPPGSTGFLPHYDHHDVLVLQVAGRKTWHLYGDTAVPPSEMQRRKEIVADELPAPTDLVLEAGDTLYLPRGRIHAAETGTEPAVHLTVGIHVPSVLDLLTHMLQLLSRTDDRIHTRLPARYLDDSDLRAGLGGIVGEALSLLADPGVLAGGLAAFEDLLVRRGRCPPIGRISDAVTIDGQTAVRKHQPLYSRVISTDDRVALQFAQLLISAAPDHQAAMRFLSDSSAPFLVGELPGLTPPQQIELARQLITSGFLLRVPPD